MSIKKILIRDQVLNKIDIHFANYICKSQESNDENLWLLIALISYFINCGDSAFNPKMVAGKSCEVIFNPTSGFNFKNETSAEKINELKNITIPNFNIDTLIKKQACLTIEEARPKDGTLNPLVGLKNSKVIGSPGESTPIIYDGELFYLNKFFQYEEVIANFIKRRVNQPPIITNIDDESNAKNCNDLFPNDFIDGKINWQKVAGILALNSQFLVISGGPGTGKTTTAGNILTLLLKQTPDLIIKMVAPTGKAADRLNESIRSFKEEYKNKINSDILNNIPETAETIHKFLGIFSHKNKIDKYSPASIDLLLIDEASMVSLPLFAKTFEALPEHCQVILLGDKDQLMAVENGNVLKDITDAEELNSFSADFAKKVKHITNGNIIIPKAANDNKINDIAIELEHSWRFDPNSGIGHLSKAINVAEPSTTQNSILQIIDKFNDINLMEISTKDEIKKYIKKICNSELEAYKISLKNDNIKDMFTLLSQFRILCALNNGPFGVKEINNTIEEFLFPHTISNSFYQGRPIMITKNDYRLGIMNGDIGILKEFDGELKACFPREDGEYKKINPSSLDEYTTAFAISIHKSQGSEFDNISIILPPEESKIVTKELIYTAVTRAKKRCTIIATKDIFHKATITKMIRQSGLKSRICQSI